MWAWDCIDHPYGIASILRTHPLICLQSQRLRHAKVAGGFESKPKHSLGLVLQGRESRRIEMPSVQSVSPVAHHFAGHPVVQSMAGPVALHQGRHKKHLGPTP